MHVKRPSNYALRPSSRFNGNARLASSELQENDFHAKAMKRTSILWTGGKDSYLAFLLAREQGYDVVSLVTFVPSEYYASHQTDAKEFQAHPQSEMLIQAEKLGMDIHFVEIQEPYRSSYINGLKWIYKNLRVSFVATGDIDEVHGMPNWIQECCKETGLEVFLPLWKKSRDWVMNELIERQVRAKISWIHHPAIPQNWLNQIIDENLLRNMKSLSTEIGFDLAGENGEYHTMVVDAPAFRGIHGSGQ